MQDSGEILENIDVKIEQDEVKGRKTIALRAFQSGEVIFSVFPIACVQEVGNEKHFVACDYCLKPLNVSVVDSLKLEIEPSLLASVEFPFEELCIPSQGRMLVECEPCGTPYCTDQCRSKAWNQYHELLCFDKNNTNHPIHQLYTCSRDCGTHNPLLNAKILATLIKRRKAEKQEVTLKDLEMFYSGPSNFDQLSLEWREFYEEQTVFLRQGLNPTNDPNLQNLLTPKEIYRLTLILNKNQQAIAPLSPFDVYWNTLKDPIGESGVNRVGLTEHQQNMAFQKLTPILSVLDSRNYLRTSSVMGYGLFPLQHFINHSCDPNARVRYFHENSSLSIVAQREIHPGEEITITYLDGEDLRLRHSRGGAAGRAFVKQQLHFDCSCNICIAC